MNDLKKIGAALVVGGGVGGIQAALDLAESGIKVYLLESKPCIGGVMAQLDKTFPTNDCAMCILAPKLVGVAQHPNVELITYADLEKIDGEAGNFGVKIRQRSSFVDWEKCNGCGECERVCPIYISNEFECDLVSRKAIYRLFPQSVPNKFTISKLGHPPCRIACPAGVNVQGYIALIRAGKYKEALELERKANPFASVCGRVCNHPCESDCARSEVDEPIAIASLKRFIADFGSYSLEQKQPNGERIAVIGSGPGGLSCAYFLARMNYRVTVYEAEEVVGGLLVLGIPEFRLPRKALSADIDYIKSFGIEMKTGTRIGEAITIDDLRKEHRVVFIATGAHEELRLGIEGEDLDGVLHCISFLKTINLGGKVSLGKKVVVIGGGNAAIDSARVAKRIGGDVVLLYRRSRREMPANPWEVNEAEEEGVKIEFLVAPNKILGDKEVEEIECVRMELGAPDASGRRRPISIPGSEFRVPVDNVIVAISQKPKIDWVGNEFERTKWGTLVTNSDTLETTVKGVYAGGDLTSGPATVIKAVAAGKKAAEAIDAALGGIKIIPKEWQKARPEYEELKGKTKLSRAEMLKLSLNKRQGFDEVEHGYDEETARKEAERCLNCTICSECSECVKVCEPKAINFDQKEEAIDLNVGSIILSPGYDLFDAGSRLEFGYLRYPNVITALEFERILSASGPYSGQVLRPSDKTPPKKIAFIQCFGSRDAEESYCSSVCCMYTTKEAIIAKEHAPGLECHIFFLDLRAFGKGFDEYYERAKNLGVKYIRCRPSSIEEVPDTKSLRIHYVNGQEKVVSEEYDLVVLSIGLRPPKMAEQISERFGIELNQYGFCRTEVFRPVESSKEGIFVCGPFTEPKDIPDTVTQASAAAAKALGLLCEVRGTLIKRREYPLEKDVKGEPPRIGVFVCHCGRNIGGVVNVPGVVEYAKTLSDVIYVEHNLYTCSTDTQEKIKSMIKEHNLNRIVVASCTPRTHEPLFRQTIRDAGLNSYLIEMANIRDQCSWVHMHMPEAATKKAKDLLRMAVAKARLLEPLPRKTVPMNPKGLIIGGGLSGMTAALALAHEGFEVYLVEKNSDLGGNLRYIHFLFNGEKPQDHLRSLIKMVKEEKRIHLYTESTILNVEGYVGNFKTTIKNLNGDKKIDSELDTKQIEHGVIVVATGAQELKPTEYLYGKDKRVITQLELEELLSEAKSEKESEDLSSPISNLQSVVMIQCVGSRNTERPYCSRVCCNEAIKNALKIKAVSSGTEIFVLFRDIRTYGFSEAYYRMAREKGVIFINYDEDEKPQVIKNNGSLGVIVKDPILNERISINPDLIVLAAATIPHSDSSDIAQMLKVPLNQEKFFLEAHMKLRPIDFATEGIYVCGLAHSAKSISESISQAYGVAARAATLLTKTEIESEAMVPIIDLEKCIGCGVCESVCAYRAIQIIETDKGKKANVVAAACKGCGTCAAVCPQLANTSGHFTDNELIAQITALGEVSAKPVAEFEPVILGFLCNWCSYAGADLAGVSRIQYEPNLRIIRVMCSGRVDPYLVVEAFLKGIDGVMILGCHPGDCHYSVGNLHAEKRIISLREILKENKLEWERVHIDWVSAAEGDSFAKIVNNFTEKIRKLGPIASKNIEQKLRIVGEVLKDSRIRTLLAKERAFTEDGDVYGEKMDQEEFKNLRDEFLNTEIIRKRILMSLKEKPLSAKDLAHKIDVSPDEIFKNILVLQRKGLLQFDRIEEDYSRYRIVKSGND